MNAGIDFKSDEEIKIMQRGGAILHSVMVDLVGMAAPGVTLKELDKYAQENIVKSGGSPSFKRVKGYHWSICACVNEVVVHGIPTDYRLEDGDVVGIDCGVFFEGFHTDSSWSVRVRRDTRGETDEVDEFLATGETALRKGIEKVRIGSCMYDVSKAIQDTVEGKRYNIVRSLIGHGIGRNLHEEPEVPGFVTKKRENTPKIVPGMVLAVEVIYTMGKPEVDYRGKDGWTIVTRDGKIAGLFEATVAVTAHGPVVLT